MSSRGSSVTNDVGEKWVLDVGPTSFIFSMKISMLGGDSFVREDSSLMSYTKGTESISSLQMPRVLVHFLSAAIPSGDIFFRRFLSKSGPSQKGPRLCVLSYSYTQSLSRVFWS